MVEGAKRMIPTEPYLITLEDHFNMGMSSAWLKPEVRKLVIKLLQEDAPLIIELFSGMGRSLDGAVRIDIDPKVRPTIVADVRFLPLRPGLNPSHLHGSPPCRYFTNAAGQIDPSKVNAIGLAESFELVAAFWRAVDWLEPEKATLETPAKGRLAKLLRERIITYKAHDLEKKKTAFYQSRRSLKRSIIPKEAWEMLDPKPRAGEPQEAGQA